MGKATCSMQWRGRELDELAGMAGLAVAVLLLPLQLMSTQLYVVVVPPLVGFACLTYLVTRRRRDTEREVVTVLSSSTGRVAAGLVFLGTGLLLAVAVLTGGRTVPFFGLAAAIGTLVLAQILFVEDDGLSPGLIIAEVLLFSLALRVSALFMTPGLVGVDSWTHITDYAASIQSLGSLSAISGVKYFAAPLYHVFVVLVSEALGTSLRMALYLSLGIVMPMVGLFVYGAARHVLPMRWALFAFAIFTFADHVVRWGIHIIPTSLGLLFFLAIFYGLTRLFYAADRRPLYVVVILLSLAIVLTHQVSAFIMLVLIGAGVVGQYLGQYVPRDTDAWFDGRAEPVNLLSLFFFEVTLVLYTWSQTPAYGGSFLTRAIGNLQRAIASELGLLNIASESGGGSETGVPMLVGVVDSIGFFVLLFVTVLGTLALLHRRAVSQPALAFIAAAVAMLGITLGLPALGIRTFLPGRWYAFMYAPMAIVGAAGCLFAVKRLPAKATLVGLLIVAVLLPGTMFVAHKGTPDSPVFDDEYPRFAYTQSELAAVETVDDAYADDRTVYTDHPYRTVFTRTGAADGKILPLGGANSSVAPRIYRTYQSDGAPLFYEGDTGIRQQVGTDTVCPGHRDRLYTNGDVLLCNA